MKFNTFFLIIMLAMQMPAMAGSSKARLNAIRAQANSTSISSTDHSTNTVTKTQDNKTQKRGDATNVYKSNSDSGSGINLNNIINSYVPDLREMIIYIDGDIINWNE